MTLILINLEEESALTPAGTKTYADLGLPPHVDRALLIDHLENLGYQVIFETL